MEEAPFDLTLDMTGVNGHTELSFWKDQVRVKWAETTVSERDLIRGLIQTSKIFGFKPWTVDEDGKPKEELKKLPGLFRGKKGEIILKGEVKKVKLLAQELIEGEVRNNHMVLEAQDDGSWKILKTGQFDPEKEPGKKKKVTTSAPVGGG